METNQNSQANGSSQAYRINTSLHDKLMKSSTRSTLEPSQEKLTLPEPVYPQRKPGADYTDKQYNKLNAVRGLKGWATPYLKSRWYSKDLRPIIAYLFTEFKCNVDCHYCWSYNNKVKGMTEDVARRSIDWLHSIGCRVLALMGGEPLLRPDFVHKVIYFAALKGVSFSSTPPLGSSRVVVSIAGRNWLTSGILPSSVMARTVTYRQGLRE